MKKLLIISGIILSLLAISLGLYYFIIKGDEKIIGGKKVSITDLFPFGNSDLTETSIETPIENRTEEEQPVDFKEKVRLISSEPVSGFTFVEKDKNLFIRYIEKGTGHIYDVSTFDDKKDKISNKTILNTQKIYFTNKGNSFVVQYLKDDNTIENSFIDIKISSSTESELNFKTLDKDIKNISSGQNNGNLFYFIVKGLNSFGFISKAPNYSNVQIWTDKIKEITPQFINDNLVILTTKPNSDSFGYSYALNSKGDMKQILGPIYGLTTKSDTYGENILFNSTAIDFSLYSLDTKTNKTILLSPQTFPEKCVFSLTKKKIAYCAVPSYRVIRNSLDNWYYGTVGFSDEIWKYDLNSNTSEKILTLSSEVGKVIDVDEIYIDKDDLFLIIRNKSDGGSLWSINLSN